MNFSTKRATMMRGWATCVVVGALLLAGCYATGRTTETGGSSREIDGAEVITTIDIGEDLAVGTAPRQGTGLGKYADIVGYELCGHNGECVDIDDGSVVLAQVVKIVDGDTLDVEVNGEIKRVRLTGINTPEHDECWGITAENSLREMLGGSPYVELVEPLGGDLIDRYGRSLRYLALDAGKTFVNDLLVLNGDARAVAYNGHVAAILFEDAERIAQTQHRGLWSATCVGDTVVTLVEEHSNAAGNDGDNLNDEWIDLRFGETGDADLDVSGWVLRDASSTNRYQFGTYTIEGGAVVRIRTGCGADTPGSYITAEAGGVLYWCSTRPVWNNGGDEFAVQDTTGLTVGSGSW